MSKSGEAFEKLTYEEIRSMVLKEVGAWLEKQIPDYLWRQQHSTPNDVVMTHFLYSEIEALKRGEIPK